MVGDKCECPTYILLFGSCPGEGVKNYTMPCQGQQPPERVGKKIMKLRWETIAGSVMLGTVVTAAYALYKVMEKERKGGNADGNTDKDTHDALASADVAPGPMATQVRARREEHQHLETRSY